MAIVQCLPEILLRQTDKFASFFSTVSAPVVENSFRFANNLSSWLWTQTPEEIVTNTDSRVAFAEALDPKVFEFIFARPVHGMSNEAILLMKKAQGVSGWADWGDYDTLVLRLRQILQENDRRLVIDVFFSETDSVIGNPGTAGPEWFKHCWKCDGEDGTIQFFSKVVSGTDHDSIWATRWGMARDVFMRIGDVHVS